MPDIKKLEKILWERAKEWPRRGEAWRISAKFLDEFVTELLKKIKTINPDASSVDKKTLKRVSKICKRPIIVGGHMKSGTNLFTQLFDGHSSILVLPGDSFLFQRYDFFNKMSVHIFVTYWIKRFINPTGQGPFFWPCEPGKQEETYIRLIGLVYEFNAFGFSNVTALVAALSVLHHQRHSIWPKFWLEKTPNNQFLDLAALQDFPEARQIFLVRRPVNNYASIKKLSELREWRGSSCFELSLNLAKSYIFIQRFESLKPDTTTLIQYEELTNSTRALVKNIAAWLGVPWRPSLLVPTMNDEAAFQNTMFDSEPVSGVVKADYGHSEQVDKFEKILICLITFIPYWRVVCGQKNVDIEK